MWLIARQGEHSVRTMWDGAAVSDIACVCWFEIVDNDRRRDVPGEATLTCRCRPAPAHKHGVEWWHALITITVASASPLSPFYLSVSWSLGLDVRLRLRVSVRPSDRVHWASRASQALPRNYASRLRTLEMVWPVRDARLIDGGRARISTETRCTSYRSALFTPASRRAAQLSVAITTSRRLFTVRSSATCVVLCIREVRSHHSPVELPF